MVLLLLGSPILPRESFPTLREKERAEGGETSGAELGQKTQDMEKE